MANYCKCPACGAAGPIGADYTYCACVVRQSAADWYDSRAAEIGGAVGVVFRKFARRIREGDADHKLAEVRRGQREFDDDPHREGCRLR